MAEERTELVFSNCFSNLNSVEESKMNAKELMIEADKLLQKWEFYSIENRTNCR